MGSNFIDATTSCGEADGSETTIEIKLKTLDSQIYTLRVDKQMPVPALKEQIASVTGVLSEQQRLICRGKVLKDDQLLSAYHVEDGHTLHLVVRQPLPPSETLPNRPETDPNSSTSRVHSNRVAPGVVIETFSMPVQGDGVPPEINRIVSAVLSSIGLSNSVTGSEGMDVVREIDQQRSGERVIAAGMIDLNQHQSGDNGSRPLSDRFHGTSGHPSIPSLGSFPPPVIPDSLTTLSQNLGNMRRDFENIGRVGGNNSQEANIHGDEESSSNSSSRPSTAQESFPTPASLAEVMLSTRQMLTGEVSECLLQLARQLENHRNVTDPTLRMNTQSSAWRSGVLFNNLGAYLLELGRTMMTLRMGQNPSEAVVNAGPAVFISQSGPNPIMVQPLPFQQNASLGTVPMGAMQPGSALIHGLGSGFLPRRIDIQIRRGSPTTASNGNSEERSGAQQPLGQQEAARGVGENPTNQATTRIVEGPSVGGESGVRVVPIRTMVAALPGPFSRLPSNSSGNSFGLYYPVLGRFPHPASGNARAERGSQASSERQSTGLQSEQHTILESVVEQQNVEDAARDGGAQGTLESERQVPSNVVQFLRTLFPGGEINIEDASFQEISGSIPTHPSMASSSVANVQESESRTSDEGMFLSNIFHQIMPFTSQRGNEPDMPSVEANTSEHQNVPDSSTQASNGDAETSRRRADSEAGAPSSKRQKKD
ncbi:ubiquitin-like domain-containing protein CIP73 isoform X2 [Benincasa hispida]|uniref:ubiquitin-like domain-containing protein CIP73 isoform X2 n=1 Tax=Benincasa hispida TaxID=102211 RepID=UPI0019006C78|nr:ubiquitin-like domain-containing protein CIP73 isoform X2 [Benincasa hispida]